MSLNISRYDFEWKKVKGNYSTKQKPKNFDTRKIE